MAKGFYKYGVLQVCWCGLPLTDEGELHPECRRIVKAGLRKIYGEVLNEAKEGRFLNALPEKIL